MISIFGQYIRAGHCGICYYNGHGSYVPDKRSAMKRINQGGKNIFALNAPFVYLKFKVDYMTDNLKAFYGMINIRQILIGMVVLLIGTLIYLTEVRGPERWGGIRMHPRRTSLRATDSKIRIPRGQKSLNYKLEFLLSSVIILPGM
jgi:hypothetical protein